MTLDEFNIKILRPMLFDAIATGRLDKAIQSEDCNDIIEADLELKKAVEQRLKVLNGT